MLINAGATGYDYQNRSLWYAKIYSELLPDLDELTGRLARGEKATAIVDRDSFGKIMNQLPPAINAGIHVIAQSEQFICFIACRASDSKNRPRAGAPTFRTTRHFPEARPQAAPLPEQRSWDAGSSEREPGRPSS